MGQEDENSGGFKEWETYMNEKVEGRPKLR